MRTTELRNSRTSCHLGFQNQYATFCCPLWWGDGLLVNMQRIRASKLRGGSRMGRLWQSSSRDLRMFMALQRLPFSACELIPIKASMPTPADVSDTLGALQPRPPKSSALGKLLAFALRLPASPANKDLVTSCSQANHPLAGAGTAPSAQSFLMLLEGSRGRAGSLQTRQPFCSSSHSPSIRRNTQHAC